MATPSRRLILEDIQTSLAAIDGTGDWKSTVTKVEKFIRGADNMVDADMPWLGFIPMFERPTTFGSFGRVHVELRVLVCGHMEVAFSAGDDEQTIQTAVTTVVSNLQDDVIAAMCKAANQSRGGNAIRTKWVAQADSDEGLPGRQSDYSDVLGIASLQLLFDIKYKRSIGSS